MDASASGQQQGAAAGLFGKGSTRRSKVADASAKFKERSDDAAERRGEASAEERVFADIADGSGFGKKIELPGQANAKASAGGQTGRDIVQSGSGVSFDEAAAAVLSSQRRREENQASSKSGKAGKGRFQGGHVVVVCEPEGLGLLTACEIRSENQVE